MKSLFLVHFYLEGLHHPEDSRPEQLVEEVRRRVRAMHWATAHISYMIRPEPDSLDVAVGLDSDTDAYEFLKQNMRMLFRHKASEKEYYPLVAPTFRQYLEKIGLKISCPVYMQSPATTIPTPPAHEPHLVSLVVLGVPAELTPEDLAKELEKAGCAVQQPPRARTEQGTQLFEVRVPAEQEDLVLGLDLAIGPHPLIIIKNELGLSSLLRRLEARVDFRFNWEAGEDVVRRLMASRGRIAFVLPADQHQYSYTVIFSKYVWQDLKAEPIELNPNADYYQPRVPAPVPRPSLARRPPH